MDKKLGNDLVGLLGSLLSEGEEVVRKMANESNKDRPGGVRVPGVRAGGVGAGPGSVGNGEKRPGHHFLEPEEGSRADVPRRGGSPSPSRTSSNSFKGARGDRRDVNGHTVSPNRQSGIERAGNVENSGDILRGDGEGVTKRSMEVVVIDKVLSKISGHIKSVVIREDMIKIQFTSDKTFVLDVDGIDISSVEIECEGHKVYVRYEK